MLRRFTGAVLVSISVLLAPASCVRRAPATVPPPPVPAVTTAAPPPAVLALPQRLTDREFWTLITDLSEPSGYFRSDNLLSNELGLQRVIPELLRTARRGRVYLGVGPDQNFTYIAALEPAMAFIVDVRRGNLDLHLLYKALFELSSDRVDFVARLFSRVRPPLPSTADVREIFTALNGVPPEEARFAGNLKAVQEHLTKTHGFPLGADDLQDIEYVYRAFDNYGPGLTYWMNSGGRFGRSSPTYADLMVATDEDGILRGYLASDANFQVLKGLEEKNLLVPIVGNFAGPKALHGLGEYLKARHALVSAFYLSNVEQYLNMDGIWTDFCANVATLPLDETSTFIRSVRSGQFGYGVGLGQQLGNMLAETKACGAAAVSGLLRGDAGPRQRAFSNCAR